MTAIVYGFALSAGAVRLLGGVSPKEARERVGTLMNLWRRNGLLVTDPGQRHMVELGKACEADSFPPSTRQVIKAFLTAPGLPRAMAENWPRGENPPPRDVETPTQGSWFVGDEEAKEWGLDDETVRVLTASGIEVCRLDGLSLSRWNLMPTSRVLKKKQPTEEALGVFAPMCGVAKTLEVVDPYCGKDEVVNPGRSGLVRFLTSLAELQPCFGFKLREVAIYTSKDVPRSMTDKTIVNGADILDAWTQLAPILQKTGLRRIVIHLVTGERFGAIAHDRFAVFDERALGRAGICAFQIGPGFSIFAGKKLSKATTLAAVPAEDVSELIRDLVGEPSHEAHEIALETAVGQEGYSK